MGAFQTLAAPGPVPRETRWFVPGRVEVLGKHTDYAGGRSLLAAVGVGLTVTARALDAGEGLRVTSDTMAETVEIALDGHRTRYHRGSAHEDVMGGGHWSDYLATATTRLARNLPGLIRPAEVHIASTLPPASGMSSSSALVTGFCLALLELGGAGSRDEFRGAIEDDETLAEYLGCVENGQSYGVLAGERGVGTFGGSEDHTAILCGRAGELAQYSFCPVRRERSVPLPADHRLVIAVSGVLAEKTGAARDLYNRASLSTRQIVGLWNEETGRADENLAAAVASDGGQDASGADVLDSDVVWRLRRLTSDSAYFSRRLDQFLQETYRIVPGAADALARGDLAGFGSLVDESQDLAERSLANQVPETIALQREARRLGAVAASAFGAGFGGSVWALVPASGAEEFAREWRSRYAIEVPDYAESVRTIVTEPSDAAHRM